MTDAQLTRSARKLGGQFLLFAGVGAIGTAAQYSVLIALVRLARMDAVLASTAGFVMGACVNYMLNYLFTFNSGKRHAETLPKFFTVALLGMGINAAIMAGLVQEAGMHYLLAQIVATGLVLVWNFAGSKLWVFREKYHEHGG
ncbi:MAG: GtrA family protein [Pseudomonadota bacterium]